MAHTSSVFNNSCFKLPRNPKSKRPLPVYEQKYLNQLKNEFIKLDLEEPNKMKSKKSEKDRIKDLIEFYGSIPEYDDLHHLSNEEFYKKIDALKEKKQFYIDDMQDSTDWIDEYKNLCLIERKIEKRPKSSLKPFCSTPILNKNLKLNKEDVESLSEKVIKPPSRRSVRIETPSSSPELSRSKSGFISSASSKGIWDDSSIEDFKMAPLETKSAPNSPTKLKPTVGWNNSGITIPKPFQMTVRDEENKIVDEVLVNNSQTSIKEKKSETFKAHPIPIESQIPLFDKIMAEQELKNQMTREKRKVELQSQMRPFSFTRRDEEIQNITREFSKSSPNLYLCETPIKTKKFKAKPIPKNLFSNYIYKKMHEDEFYRALQKKIRAEEMLRASSLPPSMAKREKTHPKLDICPRSVRSLELEKKSPKHKFNPDFQMELEELKHEFLSSPKCRKSRKKVIKKGHKYSASNSSRTQSSLELHSVNRSNLAAVLRIQSARQKLKMDLLRKLEEARLRQEALWKERIMRKKPVWQSLAYSHEEDLAMRLQMRREEEKLRSEEHRLRMELMLGRVNQQPTLFERQSQVKFPKTRQELIDHLHLDNFKPNTSISELSSTIEMKDEAIQAFLEEDETEKSKEEEQ